MTEMTLEEKQLLQATLIGDATTVERLMSFNFTSTILGIALSQACWNGNVRIVYLLLEAGANPNFTNDSDEVTPLSYAIVADHTDVVLLLLNHPDIDVNANGNIALYSAVNDLNIPMIKLLLRSGANVHMDNDWPLEHALQTDNIELARILLEAGADVRAGNNYAIRSITDYSSDVEFLRLLVDAGADIHVDEDTPLLAAIESDNVPFVKYLLSIGANIHTRDDYGMLYAIINESYDMAYVLLQAGINITPQVLDTVARVGKPEMVDLLLEYCADPTILIPEHIRRMVQRNTEMDIRDMMMYSQMGDPYMNTLTDCRRERLRRSKSRGR